MLRSRLCTQDQFQTSQYIYWCRQMHALYRFHRKQWEFCYIAQALYERGMVGPGKKGLGFAVGLEPLPSLFASYGCEIVATDLDVESARQAGWVDTNQHMADRDGLNNRGICEREAFNRLVSCRATDMNDIPPDLKVFDFTWSSCAFEHLGSIQLGLEFVLNSLKCLRPGGVAVHTTEFNVSSNSDTLSTGGTVIFRRRDIEELAHRLRAEGHKIELDFDLGNGPADYYVDRPPYHSAPHLKLHLDRYVSTSIGLIVQKAGATSGKQFSLQESTPIHRGETSTEPLSITVNRDEKFATYLKDHTALTLALGRFKLLVDTRDMSLGPHLLLDGYWDLPNTEIFNKLIKPGMTVMDVGANCGYFTLLAADLVGPQGCVYAIEADPQNFALLQGSISLNGFGDRVRAYQVAALDVRKKVRFRKHANFFGGHSIFLNEFQSGPLEEVLVEAMPLDEITQGKVDFIKIDTEGAEPFILDGMRKLLERNPHVNILVEFCPTSLRDAGVEPREFLSKLKKLGFSLSITTNSGTWEPIRDEASLLNTGTSDLLLQPTRSQAPD